MRKGSRVKTRTADSARTAEAPAEGHNRSEDSLEAGIASVFAAIQAEGIETPDFDEPESDATFVLLAELNRLWVASPAA